MKLEFPLQIFEKYQI